MRLSNLLALVSVCGWLTAHADAPATSAPASVDARKLAVNEALLNYCGPLDPQGAEKLRAKIRQLVRGASQVQLAAIRGSDDYRKARDSMTDFIGKVNERNAKRMCSRD